MADGTGYNAHGFIPPPFAYADFMDT